MAGQRDRVYVGGGPPPCDAGGPSAGLPDDLRAESARRVGFLATLIGLGWLVAYLRAWIAPQPGPQWVLTALVPTMVIGSLLFAAVVRSGRLQTNTILRLGLAYEVLIAAAISLPAHAAGYAEAVVIHGMPGACGVIVIAPMIVPVRWKWRVAATLTSASMILLTIPIAGLLGAHPPSASITAGLAVSATFFAVIALVVARVVGRLGSAVTEARTELREMGAYQLVETIGEGGMGEVWRGEHRLLKRAVAIKLIRPDRLREEDPDRRERAIGRFQREARAMASLSSPHTVQVYDYGLTDDGSFYYVMELLDGEDVEDLVERDGPVYWERAIDIVRQACASLAEAHALGLIHRDIKPSNLFVCRIGGRDGFVKVLDFGLVRDKRLEADAESVKLTATGIITGTPLYLAPETAEGTEPDARTDVYALGCVMYFLLTGRPVFVRPSVMAVVIAHIEEQPMHVQKAAAQPVPGDVAALVMRCLSKAPADRPKDAGELEDLLATLVD